MEAEDDFINDAGADLPDESGGRRAHRPLNMMPEDQEDADMATLISNMATLISNRKKGHFMKGDAVVVVRGDLKNLKGWVEEVEEDIVHVKPEMTGLPKTLAFNEKELCKYFKLGDHVKVVSGVQEGATGMVVKFDCHVLIIQSDTTKENIRVFADNVVKNSEFDLRPSSSPYLQFLGRPPRGPIDCGRGDDALVGRTIKLRSGHFKGYRARVVEVFGSFVRIELNPQVKIVTVTRDDISVMPGSATPFSNSHA